MDGTEYDCDGLHDKTCEDCLVYYKTYGGLWNPDTGKRTSIFLANILYGGKYILLNIYIVVYSINLLKYSFYCFISSII